MQLSFIITVISGPELCLIVISSNFSTQNSQLQRGKWGTGTVSSPIPWRPDLLFQGIAGSWNFFWTYIGLSVCSPVGTAHSNKRFAVGWLYKCLFFFPLIEVGDTACQSRDVCVRWGGRCWEEIRVGQGAGWVLRWNRGKNENWWVGKDPKCQEERLNGFYTTALKTGHRAENSWPSRWDMYKQSVGGVEGGSHSEWVI